MQSKPSFVDELFADFDEGEEILLEESIYDEVESYYDDDLLSLVTD